MFICLSISLSIYLSICLSFCLSVYPSFNSFLYLCFFIHPSVHLSACPSICQLVHPSIHHSSTQTYPFIYPNTYPSIYSSIHLSVSLSYYLSFSIFLFLAFLLICLKFLSLNLLVCYPTRSECCMLSGLLLNAYNSSLCTNTNIVNVLRFLLLPNYLNFTT